MAKNTPPFDASGLVALVVDDHDPMRKAVRRVISELGFGTVLEAGDASEAEGLLASQVVDLLVVDIYLRKGSGLNVLENLRARNIHSDIPVIVLTGEANKDDIVKASNLGANDYLLKPFQAADLEKKIITCMQNYLAPNEIIGLHRAAEKMILNKQYAKALAAYETVIAKDSASARGYYGKALALQALGKIDEAVNILRHNIANFPQFFKNHAALANIYLSRNQPTKAMEALKQELEANPKQVKRQLIMAKLFADQSDWKSAMSHYRLALHEQGKDKTALMGLGRCYAMQDQLEKAIQVLSRVRRHYPDDRKPLEAILKYSLEKGEPRRAEFFLKDEKRLHPEREDAYVGLFRLYEATDRFDEGVAVLEELLTRNPESIDGLKAMANVHMKAGSYEKAAPLLSRLEKLDASFEVLLPYAQCMLNLKQYPEAILLFVRACALNRVHPLVFQGLAEAHRATNQIAKAYLFQRKALAAGLSPQVAQKQLEVLRIARLQRAQAAMGRKAS